MTKSPGKTSCLGELLQDMGKGYDGAITSSNFSHKKNASPFQLPLIHNKHKAAFFVRTKLLMQFQIQEMPNSFAVALSSIAMATCQARRRRDQVTLRYVHMSSKVSPDEISEIGNVREESIDQQQIDKPFFWGLEAWIVLDCYYIDCLCCFMIAYLRPAARYKAGSLSKKEIEGCKNDPQWQRAVEKAGGIWRN